MFAAALDALSICILLDLVRTVRRGPEGTDPWVLGAPPVAVALGMGLVLLGRAWARLRPSRARTGRRVLRMGFGLLAALAFLDVGRYAGLWWVGAFTGRPPVPVSLVFGGLLLAGAWRGSVGERSRRERRLHLAAVGACGFGLVALHLLAFGFTDYRRTADAAVVFGCKVEPDGTPSGALYDRTVAGCRLYEAGLVDKLVFSGGRNPAVAASEPEAMARVALDRGIPETDLVLDERGVNTASTIRSLREIAARHGWSEVLAVSHDWHMARIRMLGRADGIVLRTVPAAETVPWPMKPTFIVREIAAWGWWYLRTLC